MIPSFSRFYWRICFKTVIFTFSQKCLRTQVYFCCPVISMKVYGKIRNCYYNKVLVQFWSFIFDTLFWVCLKRPHAMAGTFVFYVRELQTRKPLDSKKVRWHWNQGKTFLEFGLAPVKWRKQENSFALKIMTIRFLVVSLSFLSLLSSD